mgnify:CR=1 FL=1
MGTSVDVKWHLLWPRFVWCLAISSRVVDYPVAVAAGVIRPSIGDVKTWYVGNALKNRSNKRAETSGCRY